MRNLPLRSAGKNNGKNIKHVIPFLFLFFLKEQTSIQVIINDYDIRIQFPSLGETPLILCET